MLGAEQQGSCTISAGRGLLSQALAVAVEYVRCRVNQWHAARQSNFADVGALHGHAELQSMTHRPLGPSKLRAGCHNAQPHAALNPHCRADEPLVCHKGAYND